MRAAFECENLERGGGFNISVGGAIMGDHMTVRLTEHAAALLEAVRARRDEPAEDIVEEALEVLVRQYRVPSPDFAADKGQREAVSEMLEFVKRNRIQLSKGVSVKELIHQGHRI